MTPCGSCGRALCVHSSGSFHRARCGGTLARHFPDARRSRSFALRLRDRSSEEPLRLPLVVLPAEERHVRHRRLAARCERFAVMKLQEPALRTSPRRPDERASTAIPFPHRPLDGSRNVPRFHDSHRRRAGRRPAATSGAVRSDDRASWVHNLPVGVWHWTPCWAWRERLSIVTPLPRCAFVRSRCSTSTVNARSNLRRIAVRNDVAEQVLGAPKLRVCLRRNRHLHVIPGRRQRTNDRRTSRATRARVRLPRTAPSSWAPRWAVARRRLQGNRRLLDAVTAARRAAHAGARRAAARRPRRAPPPPACPGA